MNLLTKYWLKVDIKIFLFPTRSAMYSDNLLKVLHIYRLFIIICVVDGETHRRWVTHASDGDFAAWYHQNSLLVTYATI
jgi:hypothetical protein